MFGLPAIDIAAIACLVVVWIGFSLFADRENIANPGVNHLMQEFRERWMRNLVYRELRMFDSTIQATVLNGTAFFASTAILLVGGSLTVLGATDKALAVVQYLPFAQATSRSVWEMKVLLLVGIFTYSFFKFAWSYRLFIYCVIMMGAAPMTFEANSESDEAADKIAKLHGLGAKHFNRGLRAYMYGLAAITWFIHPVIFMASSVWVTFVLYRREFASRSLAILKGE